MLSLHCWVSLEYTLYYVRGEIVLETIATVRLRLYVSLDKK